MMREVEGVEGGIRNIPTHLIWYKMKSSQRHQITKVF